LKSHFKNPFKRKTPQEFIQNHHNPSCETFSLIIISSFFNKEKRHKELLPSLFFLILIKKIKDSKIKEIGFFNLVNFGQYIMSAPFLDNAGLEEIH